MVKFFSWEIILVIVMLLFFFCAGAYASWRKYNRPKRQIQILPTSSILSRAISSSATTDHTLTLRESSSFQDPAEGTLYFILVTGSNSSSNRWFGDGEQYSPRGEERSKHLESPPTYETVMAADPPPVDECDPPSYNEAVIAQKRC